MVTDLNKLAKRIIEENEYLTLATVDEKTNPWVCALAYAYDDQYNFYFLSLPDSKHSQNIKTNHTVAFAIFDSRQAFGCGVGLQIEGTIKEVTIKDYLSVGKIYLSRKYPYGNIDNAFMNGIRKLLEKRIYHFYQLTPSIYWINDPHAETDGRVQVHPL